MMNNKKRILYIFDKDNTICQTNDGSKFINNIDQQILMPQVAEKCKELKSQGHQLAIATNQGGIAYNIMSISEVQEIVSHAANLINADSQAFCPHHPKGKNEYAIECKCRKPKPGLLTFLMVTMNFSIRNTIFVGDMDSDQKAAQAAGVTFIWADEFFER